MTSNRVKEPEYVFSRSLSLAAMFASALARDRGHPVIETSDFLAGCYITDPARFLAFWSDTLKCIESINLDCGLLDPVWTYQLKLARQIEFHLAGNEGIAYLYADDLRKTFLRASSLLRENPTLSSCQIDLADFLLVIREAPQFSRLFQSGFRLETAVAVARRSS